MPYGFTGNACQKYLSNVGAAMSSARAVHSKDPYGGYGGESNSNYNTECSPDSAMSGGYSTGVGNQSNIVVNEGTYTEILQKIRMTDSGIAEELYNIANQIEEMCGTIYIVPETLPKYLAILDKVKSSLGEFQSLAEQAGTKAYEFMNEMMGVG